MGTIVNLRDIFPLTIQLVKIFVEEKRVDRFQQRAFWMVVVFNEIDLNNRSDT